MRKGFTKRMLNEESGYEKTTSADDLIINYLLDKGVSKFGEIDKHLKENRINYSKRGLFLRLKNLIEYGDIASRKNKRGHNTYFVTMPGKENISLKARLFSWSAQGLLKAFFPPYKSEANEKIDYFLRKIVTRTGFFILFSFLSSLRFTSREQSDEENMQALVDWIENSVPTRAISKYLAETTDRFLTFDSDEDALAPVYSDKKRRMALQFKDVLKKIYPNEYEFCERRFLELGKDVKSHRETQSFTKRYDEWIRRLDIKMRKGPVTDVSPPKCPRCQHNGFGLVKSGPFKGIRMKGFTEVEFPSGKKLYCDVCRYSVSLVSDS